MHWHPFVMKSEHDIIVVAQHVDVQEAIEGHLWLPLDALTCHCGPLGYIMNSEIEVQKDQGSLDQICTLKA